MTPGLRYARCEAFTLEREGGFVDHPLDKGGPTNRGVTLPALTQYLGRPATLGELLHMSDGLTAALYRAIYWDAVQGNLMTPGVDLVLFDGAVNSGRRRSVAWVQRALGLEADGAIGPVTRAAIQRADKVALIKAACGEREKFLRSLGNFATFGHGWIRRVDAVAAQALGWALTEPSTQGAHHEPL